MELGFLNIGTSEMLLIVFAALLLFGGKKLPELARGLGRGIREFKDASETIKKDISDQINNFEKDVEVKSLIVEDEQEKKPSTSSASATKKATDEENLTQDVDSALPAAHPILNAGAPAGTFQHNPGREPDYVGNSTVDSTPQLEIDHSKTSKDSTE